MNNTKILYGSPRFASKTYNEWLTKCGTDFKPRSGELLFIKTELQDSFGASHTYNIPILGDGLTRLQDLYPLYHNVNLKFEDRAVSVGYKNTGNDAIIIGSNNVNSNYAIVLGNNTKDIQYSIIAADDIQHSDSSIYMGGQAESVDFSISLGGNFKHINNSVIIDGNNDTETSVEGSFINVGSIKGITNITQSFIIGQSCIGGLDNNKQIAHCFVLGKENKLGQSSKIIVGDNNTDLGIMTHIAGTNNIIAPASQGILIVGQSCKVAENSKISHKVSHNILVGQECESLGSNTLLVGHQNKNIFNNPTEDNQSFRYCHNVALIGAGLQSVGSNSLIVGAYNSTIDKQLVLAVGCGNNDNDRRNSLAVDANGRITVPLDPQRKDEGHRVTINTALPFWAVVKLISFMTTMNMTSPAQTYQNLLRYLNNSWENPETSNTIIEDKGWGENNT